MKLARFNALARSAGLGGARFKDGTGNRSLKAARLHLVGGLSVEAARKRVGKISKQSVYETMKRLPTALCRTCNQPLPQDRATTQPRARANRGA